jgi:hypothetical protein
MMNDTITIRTSQGFYNILRAQAKKRQQTVSGFIRSLVNRGADSDMDGFTKREVRNYALRGRMRLG